MIRRLTIAALALGLASCSEPAPEKAAAPAATVAATPAGFEPTASPTLERVRRRGWVACGVHPGLPGFAFPDARGGWRGFDVDLCRAVAAAVLGEATKVRFTPVTAAARFDALRRGDIDILSRNTSQTLARDAGLGLTFPATTYYDGQGVLVARSLGLTSV